MFTLGIGMGLGFEDDDADLAPIVGFLLLENDVDEFLLEDGSGTLLLEG